MIVLADCDAEKAAQGAAAAIFSTMDKPAVPAPDFTFTGAFLTRSWIGSPS